ncbi:MAG: Rrf2 family transcriptional regulator, partial [Opitutaceae bacterium]
DSSEMAFKIAGSMAFKDAAKKAGLFLLEPIMKVEVTTPDENMGDIIGDITSRRGSLGGYVLARSPEEISLYDILLAVEGECLHLSGNFQGRSGRRLKQVWAKSVLMWSKKLRATP